MIKKKCATHSQPIDMICSCLAAFCNECLTKHEETTCHGQSLRLNQKTKDFFVSWNQYLLMKLADISAKINAKGYSSVIEVQTLQGQNQKNLVEEFSAEITKQAITVIEDYKRKIQENLNIVKKCKQLQELMESSVLKDLLLTAFDSTIFIGVIFNNLKANLKKKITNRKIKIDGLNLKFTQKEMKIFQDTLNRMYKTIEKFVNNSISKLDLSSIQKQQNKPNNLLKKVKSQEDLFNSLNGSLYTNNEDSFYTHRPEMNLTMNANDLNFSTLLSPRKKLRYLTKKTLYNLKQSQLDGAEQNEPISLAEKQIKNLRQQNNMLKTQLTQKDKIVKKVEELYEEARNQILTLENKYKIVSLNANKNMSLAQLLAQQKNSQVKQNIKQGRRKNNTYTQVSQIEQSEKQPKSNAFHKFINQKSINLLKQTSQNSDWTNMQQRKQRKGLQEKQILSLKSEIFTLKKELQEKDKAMIKVQNQKQQLSQLIIVMQKQHHQMSDQLCEMMNQIPMKSNKVKDNLLASSGKNFKNIVKDKNNRILNGGQKQNHIQDTLKQNN